MISVYKIITDLTLESCTSAKFFNGVGIRIYQYKFLIMLSVCSHSIFLKMTPTHWLLVSDEYFCSEDISNWHALVK